MLGLDGLEALPALLVAAVGLIPASVAAAVAVLIFVVARFPVGTAAAVAVLIFIVARVPVGGSFRLLPGRLQGRPLPLPLGAPGGTRRRRRPLLPRQG